MAQVKIRKFGPIRDIVLNINRINVIIGPQSSGKSTIAKVICFCQWLEKVVIQHRSADQVTDEFVKEHLVKYHQFANYVNADSLIVYESDFIDFTYNGGSVSINVKPKVAGAKLPKIAYIPSERNVITMPGIASLPLPLINLRSFVFDWLDIHSKFTEENPIGLLNLGMNYHFDKSSNKDIITLENGISLVLSEASSGVQSVVPLYVYLKYYTEWIYTHSEDRSFEEDSVAMETLTRFFLNRLLNNEDPSLLKLGIDGIPIKHFVKQVGKMDIDEIKHSKELLELRELEDNITKPHLSKITLEEPEQNLFPETQVTLLYDIVRMMDNGRDNLFITTHSPYILYALNNCMLGWIVKDNIPEEMREDPGINEIPFMNPEEVSVWELRNGEFNSPVSGSNGRIQDEKGLIRGNYFDRVMKNVMGQFFNLISFMD